MIHTSILTSRNTSNPIIFLRIKTLAFPFNHCVIVAGIRSYLSLALMISHVVKFSVRRSEAVRWFLFWCFFNSFFMMHFHSVKRVERGRHGTIWSWIRLFQASFSTFFCNLFMFVDPKMMISSLFFGMRNLIMWIVATWAWNGSRKKLCILIKESFGFYSMLFRALARSWRI